MKQNDTQWKIKRPTFLDVLIRFRRNSLNIPGFWLGPWCVVPVRSDVFLLGRELVESVFARRGRAIGRRDRVLACVVNHQVLVALLAVAGLQNKPKRVSQEQRHQGLALAYCRASLVAPCLEVSIDGFLVMESQPTSHSHCRLPACLVEELAQHQPGMVVGST